MRIKHKLLLKKDPHDGAQPQRIYNSISIRIMQPNHNSSLAHIVSILLVITQFVNTINQISTHTVPTPTNASQLALKHAWMDWDLFTWRGIF